MKKILPLTLGALLLLTGCQSNTTEPEETVEIEEEFSSTENDSFTQSSTETSSQTSSASPLVYCLNNKDWIECTPDELKQVMSQNMDETFQIQGNVFSEEEFSFTIADGQIKVVPTNAEVMEEINTGESLTIIGFPINDNTISASGVMMR